MAPQDVNRAIDCVAFRNAPEIELDSRPVEGDRPIARAQHDVLEAYPATELHELVVRRNATLAVKEAPRLHERTDGDVERAVGLAAVSQRLGDEVEELRFHRHRAG